MSLASSLSLRLWLSRRVLTRSRSLLADLKGLPPHVIYVAGQDPCRDEGIAYSQKLTESGIKNQLWIYQGVPHEFGDFDELDTTQRFNVDLKKGFEALLDQ